MQKLRAGLCVRMPDSLTNGRSLPPTGTSAITKVRLMYILKGNDTGSWSDWQQWTLTGV